MDAAILCGLVPRLPQSAKVFSEWIHGFWGWSFSVSWALPEYIASAISRAEEVAEGDLDAGEEVRICEIRVGEGVCGKCFLSLRALAYHQRRATAQGHGLHHVTNLLVLDNACISCGALFPDRAQAARHLARSWRKGRCVKNNTREPYPQLPTLPYFQCSVCDDAFFDEFPEYAKHALTRLPSTLKGHAIKVKEVPTSGGARSSP